MICIHGRMPLGPIPNELEPMVDGEEDGFDTLAEEIMAAACEPLSDNGPFDDCWYLPMEGQTTDPG